MLRILTILLVALSLTGCVTPEMMNQNMNSWMGADANDLIAAWGPPSSTMSDGQGGQIFFFDQSTEMVTPGYATTTTYDTSHRRDHYGSARTTYTPPTVHQINRKRMFWVDKKNKIYRWSWQGL
jgi:hypothetical protein